MNDLRFLALWVCVFIASVASSTSVADERSKSRSQRNAKRNNTSTVDRASQAPRTNSLDPTHFRETCYRIGSPIPVGVSAAFLTSPYQWPQPDGPGSSITLTYSYSNLLGGTISGVSDEALRAATEEALAVWAQYVPIHFVEVEDSGPTPTASESSYSASNRAHIRIGAHTIDGSQGGELAHAFLPYSTTDGMAGDLHFDVDEDWTENDGGFLLEVVLHELGHVLGLDHVENVDAIMNPFVMNRFSGLGQAYLLPDDIDGIRSIYGEGVGSVEPLVDDGTDSPDDGSDHDSDANDLSVTFDETTGKLTIAGDAANNQLVIQSCRWYIAVLGLNGTTVNSKSFQAYYSTADKSIVCDLGDGDDAILWWGARAEEVTCTLGTGDDLAAVLFSRLTSLSVDGGQGDDQFFDIISAIETVNNSGFE
jgi:Matrixin